MENEEIINLIDRIHEVDCLAGAAFGVAIIALVAFAFLALKVFLGDK